MQRFTVLLAVGAIAAAAHAQSLVIPNGYANVEGNTSNAFPWGRTGIGLRHQCVYDSSHFTNQAVNFPIVITGLKWRPNQNVALVASSYTQGCTVSLSTCPVDQASVQANFTANQGSDLTVCYSGPVSWGAQPAQPGPTPFGISIPLQTPFLYDPNAGDLNIECDLPIQTFTGSGPQLDVESGATTALASRVYMSTGYPAGTTFTTNNHAVVVEVTYAPASGYAIAAPYGTGCNSAADVPSYELFPTSAGFDLSNTAISFLRTANGYTAIPGFTTYVAPSGAATSLALSDDSETQVTLGSPFPYSASSTTTTLTVCSNGFISASSGNGTGYIPTAANFLNNASMWWSIGWHDFNPAAAGSGQVKFEEVGGVAYITWDGVLDFSGTPAALPNTMQAQFELATGNVHFVYQTMSTVGGQGFLVGVSDAGPSADPGSIDISAVLPSTYTALTFRQTPLTHAASARPVLGTTINLNTANIPAAGIVGLTILGVTQYPTGLDLTFLGMPTCNLYTSLDVTLSFLPTGGAGGTPLTIPNNPALAGASIYSQGAAWVPPANSFGFLVSNGVRLTMDAN